MKKAEAMQRLSECMRLQRLSRNIIKAYSDWLDRYITLLPKLENIASPLDCRKAA